ncbi:MAG: hypothetical protein AAF351_04885 [Pseudomonadota bacterium]
MTLTIIGIAIFGFFALIFLSSTVRNSRRRRPIRAGGSFLACLTTAAIAISAALLLFSYTGYKRLTAEQLVGIIEFSRSSAEEYTARLMLDGELDRLLPMRGDEWQLDARVVTWQPPATLLGLEPVYQLERLSGRYSSVESELTEPRTVHSLADERPLDLWSLAREFPTLTPGVDAFYGTATYLPMVDGARYRITLSRDALIARPLNDIARDAVGNWGQQPD